MLTIVPSIAAASAFDTELPKLATEILRYSRHLLLPEVGLKGQRTTARPPALGSPFALYLAAAGVGTLGIVDFDAVDFTNLQRQMPSGTSSTRHDLESAKARLADLAIRTSTSRRETIRRMRSNIIREYDIVVDGTDKNFPTRYLNDACVLLGKPNVFGSRARPRSSTRRRMLSLSRPRGLVRVRRGGVLGVLPGW